jgi:chemotaxis family two-component system response regulator Rcp1
MEALMEIEGRRLEVLLVEDSIGDVRLTREAFREANDAINLYVATDGVEALSFLKREGDYIFCPRPDLILLDLNMPKMDGRELLAILKVDEDFKTIPVVILTTSNTEGDITKSYQLSANCYLSKPVQLDEFEALVKSISDFWLTKVSLPKTKIPLNTHAHDKLLGEGNPRLSDALSWRYREGNLEVGRSRKPLAKSLALAIPCSRSSLSEPLFGTQTVIVMNSFLPASSMQIVT